MGKLIVLEGLDGAGKSSQVELLTKYFEQENFSYEFFHFPMYGHNQFSDLIAKFLRGELGKIDEVDPIAIATLYAMDRFKFLPELDKALRRNDIVLLDRYVFSNIAFQCAKLDQRDTQAISWLSKWILDFEFGFLKLPYPDLNIFLDVPIEVIRERLENKREGNDREYLKGKQDIHEADLEFQDRVRQSYNRSFKDNPNCLIVNCAIQSEGTHWFVLSPENLFEEYKSAISGIIDENRNILIGMHYAGREITGSFSGPFGFKATESLDSDNIKIGNDES